MPTKGRSKKRTIGNVWEQGGWKVMSGRLDRTPGRPPATKRLFSVVAEKLPYESLTEVRDYVVGRKVKPNGVYLAHDSMGVARYGGRGSIFERLKTRKKKHPRELLYFSFYIVASKTHEREIETALLRAAGTQMSFNERKIRSGIAVGNVSDFEPGTYFLERRTQKEQKGDRE